MPKNWNIYWMFFFQIKSAWESLPSSLTKVDFVDFIDYFSQPTDCNINIKVESCSSMDQEHEKEDKRIKTIWDNISPSSNLYIINFKKGDKFQMMFSARLLIFKFQINKRTN